MNQWQLYLVTDGPLSKGMSVEQIVEQAIAGGVTCVQLREKSMCTRDFIALAERILPLTRAARVPCLINDRVDVALATHADRVHLGQEDMPYSMARKLLGPDKIIGLSVENIDQVKEAQALDVDYLGVSPIYCTPTKKELQTQFGIEGLRDVRALSKHPLVAIGGLNLQTIPDVVRAGADGVAVVSAICSADNPHDAAAQLKRCISRAQEGDHA